MVFLLESRSTKCQGGFILEEDRLIFRQVGVGVWFVGLSVRRGE